MKISFLTKIFHYRIVTMFFVFAGYVVYMYLILFYLQGCDIAEPERFYYKSVEVSPNAILYLSDIQPYQHLTGTTRIYMKFDTVSKPIKEIKVFIDNRNIADVKEKPYYFHLPFNESFNNFSVGEHTLQIYVIFGDNGLLSVLEIPQLYYTVPIIYDPTPPTPVAFEKIEFKNGHPVISWTRNNDANFRAYLIKTSNTAEKWVRTDTILDRNTTTFIDTNTTLYYTQDLVHYQVSVTNGSRITSTKESTFSFTRFLPINSKFIVHAEINDRYDILYTIDYYLGAYGLSAFSTQDFSLIKSFQLEGSGYNNEFDFCVSGDGESFCVIYQEPYGTNNTHFRIYDAKTLKLITTFSTDLKDFGKIASINNNLYVATGNMLYIIDISKKQIIDTLAYEDVGTLHDILIDQQKKLLFLFGSKYYGVIDISNIPLTMKNSVSHLNDTHGNPHFLYNNRLFVVNGSNNIFELNPETMETINTWEFKKISLITDFCIDDNNIYIVENNIDKETGYIYEFSMNDYSVKRIFKIIPKVNSCIISTDRNYLFAFSNLGWIIPLH